MKLKHCCVKNGNLGKFILSNSQAGKSEKTLREELQSNDPWDVGKVYRIYFNSYGKLK